MPGTDGRAGIAYYRLPASERLHASACFFSANDFGQARMLCRGRLIGSDVKNGYVPVTCCKGLPSASCKQVSGVMAVE